MFLYWLLYCIIWLPQKLLMPVKVYNKKKLLRKQAVILAGNHQSNLDVVALAFGLGLEPNFLAKHQLFKNKFWTWFFRNLNCIPVKRGEVGLNTIRSVLGVLKANKPMVIFPEGARMKEMGDADSLKGGVAMFSLKSGCYIQPLFFLNKPGLFKINRLIVGDPFKLTEFEGQKLTNEILQKASKVVGQKMLELRESFYLERAQKKNKKLNKKTV